MANKSDVAHLNVRVTKNLMSKIKQQAGKELMTLQQLVPALIELGLEKRAVRR